MNDIKIRNTGIYMPPLLVVLVSIASVVVGGVVL